MTVQVSFVSRFSTLSSVLLISWNRKDPELQRVLFSLSQLYYSFHIERTLFACGMFISWAAFSESISLLLWSTSWSHMGWQWAAERVPVSQRLFLPTYSCHELLEITPVFSLFGVNLFHKMILTCHQHFLKRDKPHSCQSLWRQRVAL